MSDGRDTAGSTASRHPDLAGAPGSRGAGVVAGGVDPARLTVSAADPARLTVSAVDVLAFLARAQRTLGRHRSLLDRLDASLGDGDHGENMTVGFAHTVRSLEAEGAGTDVGDLLRRAGHVLLSSVGGAGGSLYGTALIEAGFAVAGSTSLGPADLVLAFDAAADGLARRGRCDIGDKTIFDAMRPAADAFREGITGGLTPIAALRRAADAARAGMRATTPLVARRGLALRLGERSRGHQDPGATSCFLLVRAMLDRDVRHPA